MRIGTLGVMAGTLGVLFAVAMSSTVGLFAGTVVAGMGFGASFQGAMRRSCRSPGRTSGPGCCR